MPKITRRRVLASAAGLAVISGFSPSMRGLGTDGGRTKTIRFGAQTNAWPIDPNNFDTLIGALSQIRQVGYAGFETGFLNLRSQFTNAEEVRSRIASIGLTFFGVHIFLQEYDWLTAIAPRELYEPVARAGAAMGAERLIFSGAPAVTPEEVQRKASALNAAGEFSRNLGLTLAYHNHWWEFKWNGKEIEGLYTQTDPSLVAFLLDAGHAYRTGVDIPAFVKRHHDRLTGIHLRDYRGGRQVPLGQGTFPLNAVATALQEVDWSGWVLNEEEREDGAKLGITAIEPAFQALQGAFSS
jgi:inosose dehydratase